MELRKGGNIHMKRVMITFPCNIQWWDVVDKNPTMIVILSSKKWSFVVNDRWYCS